MLICASALKTDLVLAGGACSGMLFSEFLISVDHGSSDRSGNKNYSGRDAHPAELLSGIFEGLLRFWLRCGSKILRGFDKFGGGSVLKCCNTFNEGSFFLGGCLSA